MNNVEMIQRAYQYFSEGKIDSVLALFHPEIVWDVCQGFPYFDDEGIYHGPKQIAEEVFAKLPHQYENFRIDIQELFGSGEKVVMMGHYRGTFKSTGRPFVANATHVWTIKDGKAAHFFQAVDTAEIVNPG